MKSYITNHSFFLSTIIITTATTSSPMSQQNNIEQKITFEAAQEIFFIQTMSANNNLPYDIINIIKQNSNHIRNHLNNSYNKEQWNHMRPQMIEKINKNIEKLDQSEYDTWGYTPLCYAIEGNDFDFVKFLLRSGANVNKDIKNVHSNKPIFFAKTLEMVQLLQNYGADIYVQNTGTGVTKGMNLLHTAISPTSKDDRIIKYALEQGIDPQSLNESGGNICNSLFDHFYFFPEETLLKRAQLLHDLNINPHHKNNRGESAIDKIEAEIKENTEFLNKLHTNTTSLMNIDNRIEKGNTLQKLLNFVKDGKK